MKSTILAAFLSALLFSCGDKDEEKPVAAPEPEVASCKFVTRGGLSPLYDLESDDEKTSTPVLACYESPSQLTVDWCESASSDSVDNEKTLYSLYKGEKSCPLEDRVGKCVYLNTFDGEEVTIWYYAHDEVDTDFDLVRKGCNYEGMYFSLI